MMTKLYKPIACASHDQYEIAIMQKKQLHIKWLDDNGEPHSEAVLPTDILVKNKEEFLVATGKNNKPLVIRLDNITLLSI